MPKTEAAWFTLLGNRVTLWGGCFGRNLMMENIFLSHDALQSVTLA